jgi:hypothetical protein
MKKQELRKLITENITDWLAERSQQEEADSGDMAYTEKATVKEKVAKIEDQIAEFYYVTKPTKESSVEELVKSGDVFEFAMSGLTREDISGIYKSESRAKSAANKIIKERDIKLKETYKKGQDKLKQMEASIDEIKGQIEGKMSEATSNPDMREALTSESNSLMEKLSMLEMQMDKLREALEKEGLRFEKKSSKKAKKEDEKEDKKDEKEDK